MATQNFDMPAIRAELAPTGTLRVALNLANFLLINAQREADGTPTGIAPDIGRELARRLAVPVEFVPYAQPGELAAAVSEGAWDVGLIGADPLRAGEIAFTPAYLEIEATYLVLADSPIQVLEEVDRPGVRIAVADKSAYDMFLRRTLKHATLHRAEGLDGSYEMFLREGLDVLAGLKPRLLADQTRHPGSRVLAGRFTSIQQAIGTPIARRLAAPYLKTFGEQIKADLVAQLIAKHDVRGVTVAPMAT
jgi:polar amino acid transport system substrate-binding protein